MTAYADKLRAFADYIEDHPLIAEKLSGSYDYPAESLYVDSWDEFQTLINTLGGFEKSGYAGNLQAMHTLCDTEENIIYRVRVSVSGVCTAKPKVDEEGNPVMRKKSVYVETDEMEQVIEYDCPEVWTQ